MATDLVLSKKQLGYCRVTIEDFVKSKINGSNSTGAVVGLSGGLDSSVVTKLIWESGVDVRVLIMPEIGVNNPNDITDAVNFAKSLGIKSEVIEVNDTVENINHVFHWSKFSQENKKISLANIKPRVRMIMLYAIANLENRLVLGTSNKTELLLGYFTKYGDSGSDILPIADLYKTQVRQLAKYMKIPERIIKKVPTAGLWKGQTDESEIGMKYENIDKILFQLVEKKKSVKETAKILKIDEKKVKNIYERIKKTEHKRKMPPIARLDL